MQDASRLLFYLAVIGGHFESPQVKGIASLQSMTPGEIRFKRSSLDLPVFSRVNVEKGPAARGADLPHHGVAFANHFGYFDTLPWHSWQGIEKPMLSRRSSCYASPWH